MKFSNIIVIAVVILNVIFTATVLYVFSKVGSEPTVLIGSWFGFTISELLGLASIKKAKERNKKND